MKPLLGQAQSQLNLDDLFNSSKAVGGNFSRPRRDEASVANGSSRKPNFSEVLLKNLEDTKSAKPSADVRSTTDARPSKVLRKDSQPLQYKSPNRAATDRDVGSQDATTAALQRTQIASPSRQRSDNQAVDNKAAFRDSAQKLDPALAPLQKQIGDKLTTDSVINNNAVLAFITGRLDKLEPDTLPALIADSQLIKQVLGSGDVAKFMESPQSINELANLLELDQNLLSKAARDGLNPSDLVKPKEFIKALGIDPGQVTSELTILQQKLPIEGVAPFIDRARALAALKNKSELLPNAAENPATKTGQSKLQQVTPSLESTVPSQASDESANNIDRGLASMLASSSIAQATSPKSANSMTADVTTNQLSRSDITSGLGATNRYLNENAQATPDLQNADAFDRVKSLDDLNTLIASANDQKNLGTIEESNLQLSVSQADPFAMSSSEIDQNSSTRIEFAGNGINSRSLEEILLDRNVDLSIQAKQTNPVQGDSSEIGLRANDVSDLEQITAPTIDLADMTDVKTPSTESSLGIPVANLEQNFRDGGRQFDEGSREGLKDFAMSIDSKTSTTKDASSVSFSNKLTTPAANQPRESLAQRILGQAEIMFKNGGGSMRMDVEAPGIGKVDVAINLNNNQLDVRIITTSDQARDIITREVAGLRDGLNQQGLNLRGLEVGKAGEPSSRNFAGQGGQHFGQGAQDQRASYNDMKEYVQSFRNSYNPRSSDRFDSSSASVGKWNNVAQRSFSGSRLEVRV